MSVEFNDNTTRVKNDISNGIGLALRFMLDDIYTEATPKTPKNLGDLRLRVSRQMQGNNKAIITWLSSYASVQEQGYRNSKNGKIYFKKYTTPDTGPHFAEDAVELIISNLPSYISKAGIL